MKNFIAQEVSRACAEPPQAEVHTQIKESFVDMLQLGNTSNSNGMMTTSVRVLGKNIAEIFSGGAANVFKSEYQDCWMKLDKFINAIVNWIVSDLTFKSLSPDPSRDVLSCFSTHLAA